jgi:hypothetical protein
VALGLAAENNFFFGGQSAAVENKSLFSVYFLVG